MEVPVVNGEKLVLRNYRWVLSLDRNPEPLLEAIRKDKTARVLGNYFARMWSFFLGNAPNPLPDDAREYQGPSPSSPAPAEEYQGPSTTSSKPRGLRTKLQVRDPATKRTLGAYDLTFLHHATMHHWEVSFKCKLLVPPPRAAPGSPGSPDISGESPEDLRARMGYPPSLGMCSGPHQSETLEDKVNIVKRQLKLGFGDVGVSTLKATYAPLSWRDEGKIKRTCVLNGFVLYPLPVHEAWKRTQRRRLSEIDAETLSPAVPGVRGEGGGWWTEDLHALAETRPRSLWYVLPKLAWLGALGPWDLHDLKEKGLLMSTPEFVRHVERCRDHEPKERRKRVFVAEIQVDQLTRGLGEVGRGFVMEEGWLQKYRTIVAAKKKAAQDDAS
uniref:Uncharacterized protein n=1 Tax=Lotharella oceanica TaxID=641309 RepID=A0A7S2TVW6_9EUKA|mmetsp:Transcript_32318/g.60147  ORF Transcript_32318/g.60147 Transcript_32318/m.60147 type:complete len:385 (+) Transcript_32318:266-1420(+)